MYKVIVAAEQPLSRYNSDTFRIISETDHRDSNNLGINTISHGEKLVGSIHLFRNIAVQAEGMFYQPKSRLLLITHPHPTLI